MREAVDELERSLRTIFADVEELARTAEVVAYRRGSHTTEIDLRSADGEVWVLKSAPGDLDDMTVHGEGQPQGSGGSNVVLDDQNVRTFDAVHRSGLAKRFALSVR